MALFIIPALDGSDVDRLGKQHARHGWLRFKQHKNRNRHPVDIEIPILPELQAIIDASPTGDLTYLVTDSASRSPLPVSATRCGSGAMKRHCHIAQRMACARLARRAPLRTAPPNELMAIFGWKSSQEAEGYTKTARRKKMAGDAMKLLRRSKT